MKKTKIVATIGPASLSRKTLEKMFNAGMNVCRLNFSHGDREWNKKAIKNIRAVEKKVRKKIGIMADIQGPRVRIANRNKVVAKKGETLFLTDGLGKHNQNFKKDLVLDWKGFYEYLKGGDRVYIEDGLLQLEVTKRLPGGCSAKVLVGGELKPRKGVNIPSISKHLGFLTSKDLKDLEFILKQDVDFIAASFVADRNDLRNLKKVIKMHQQRGTLGGQKVKKQSRKKPKTPWIIPKIERRKALKNIAEIIKESDAIMVARGDLAIETPQEEVALHQKDLIKRCRRVRKPVIVATQMMASMINNARPTRAEISDVTNAVIDNADAVMLSNESAVGEYPVESIATMSEIIKSTEDSPYNDVKLKKRGKLARMLLSKKRKKERVLKVKTLKEAAKASALRQESVKVSLTSRKVEDKRRATLMWGTE